LTATDDHAHHIEPRPGARASLEEALRREGVQPIRSADDLACDGIFETDEELDEDVVSPELLEDVEKRSRQEYKVEEILDETFHDLNQLAVFLDDLTNGFTGDEHAGHFNSPVSLTCGLAP